MHIHQRKINDSNDAFSGSLINEGLSSERKIKLTTLCKLAWSYIFIDGNQSKLSHKEQICKKKLMQILKFIMSTIFIIHFAGRIQWRKRAIPLYVISFNSSISSCREIIEEGLTGSRQSRGCKPRGPNSHGVLENSSNANNCLQSKVSQQRDKIS